MSEGASRPLGVSKGEGRRSPMSHRVRQALYRLRALIREAEASLAGEEGADSGMQAGGSDDAAVLALAVEKLTDSELSLLLRAGVLDPMSCLVARDDASSLPAASAAVQDAVSTSSPVSKAHEHTSQADAGTSGAAEKEAVRGKEAEEEDSHSDLFRGLVDSPRQLADAVEAMASAEELFGVLSDDLLGHVTEDLAPATLKARRGAYGQVSATELEAMEQNDALSHDIVTDATASPNAFLRALAHRDEKIRQSLDVLDRARRAAVLDPNFQQSLEYVNHRAQEKFKAASGLRVRMRPKAAEIPFFFASQRSRPPPAADMGLPMPTLPVAERRRLRKEKRGRIMRKFFRR